MLAPPAADAGDRAARPRSARGADPRHICVSLGTHIELEDGTVVNAYKHRWTRQYLHLAGSCRAFRYVDAGVARWLRDLSEKDATRNGPAIRQLEHGGPGRSSSVVKILRGSRHHNMKELRSIGGMCECCLHSTGIGWRSCSSAATRRVTGTAASRAISQAETEISNLGPEPPAERRVRSRPPNGFRQCIIRGDAPSAV